MAGRQELYDSTEDAAIPSDAFPRKVRTIRGRRLLVLRRQIEASGIRLLYEAEVQAIVDESRNEADTDSKA